MSVCVCVCAGASDCTVTSDTQTGLDCWWRILSLRVSYQWWDPGCRSTRATGGGTVDSEKDADGEKTQFGGKRLPRVWRVLDAGVANRRRGGCSVSSA